MQIFSIQKAKVKLSRLVDQAANGKPFIIAKAGKPMVKVMPLNVRVRGKVKRVGIMAGKIMVPDDFDRIDHEEIKQLFGGC